MSQRRSLLLVVAAVVLMSGIWLFMTLNATTHQALDQRVYNVAEQLKCPVCQGESVADSTSLLAQQMRVVIREQLQQGRSESEVLQYFSQKYGEQIIWSPPWQGFTLLAWLAPLILLLGGLCLLFFLVRDWHKEAALHTLDSPAQLSEDDDPELALYRAQLERELAEEDSLFQRPGMEAH